MADPSAVAYAQGDFAQALRTAIGERGLTLERIRYHLQQRGHDVSVATLSYWQSGRSRPERAGSLAALGSLEEILGVPRGSIAGTVPGRRPRGTPPPQNAATTLDGLFDAGGELDVMAEELGLDWSEGFRHVSTYESVILRADGTLASHPVQELFEATRDGLDRVPIGYTSDEPGAIPYVDAVRNCRLGRVIERPEQSMLVAELLFNRSLRAGDSLVIEYVYGCIGALQPVTVLERAALQRTREIHLEVAFTPENLPRTAEKVTVLQGQVTREPIVVSGKFLSLLASDFGPGVVGLAWSW